MLGYLFLGDEIQVSEYIYRSNYMVMIDDYSNVKFEIQGFASKYCLMLHAHEHATNTTSILGVLQY